MNYEERAMRAVVHAIKDQPSAAVAYKHGDEKAFNTLALAAMIYDGKADPKTVNAMFREVFGLTPCWKCDGTKSYMYDENHGTVCDACCKHDQPRWRLSHHYAGYPGMCCGNGCGHVVRTPLEKLHYALRYSAVGQFFIWKVFNPYGDWNWRQLFRR